ncbi:MAG TPA: hypothetical protein VGI66_12835 [Streptosporangiaceae bacterium]
MLPTVTRTTKLAAAVAAGLASLSLAGPALASDSNASGPASGPLQVQQILNGNSLRHTFTPAGSTTPVTDPLTNVDDITAMGHLLFVSFQNGVGAQGEPSADGNTHSTVVEFNADGTVLGQWDLLGKCDGVTADRQRHELIATVNEDANSSIYTIAPFAPAGDQVQHYTYNEPLPHQGGTDAISIYHGQVFVTASAPGTAGTPVTSPAVYSVSFNPTTLIATITPVFNDTDQATVANVGLTFGTVLTLALTDPDSSEVVPFLAPRFGGSFMLDSQGDDEQIFLRPNSQGDDQGAPSSPSLSVLSVTTSVDDSAWATSFSGSLFGTDSHSDTVDMVTGPFRPGTMYVAATPCNDNLAPATCPAPGFPANFLAVENMWTGAITHVTLTGPAFQAKGLIFVRG